MREETENVKPALALERARDAALREARPLTPAELYTLAQLTPDAIGGLLALAGEVQRQRFGRVVQLEVLFNAKRGGCSEDCSFCSQSARFATGVEPTRLQSVAAFVEAARSAWNRGAEEFCIVVAVRGPSAALVTRVVEAVERIKGTFPLRVAVSLGLLDAAQVDSLREAGVDKINHNLETSRRYFPQICTTHTFEERLRTCRLIKSAGLELCCGGIIGMGEDLADRVDFLATLQDLEVGEVPINFLDPRPGTPLAGRSTCTPLEALHFVALARLALPAAVIRLAGGREKALLDQQDAAVQSGANALILGDYLTTKGREDREDYAMLQRIAYDLSPPQTGS